MGIIAKFFFYPKGYLISVVVIIRLVKESKGCLLNSLPLAPGCDDVIPKVVSLARAEWLVRSGTASQALDTLVRLFCMSTCRRHPTRDAPLMWVHW